MAGKAATWLKQFHSRRPVLANTLTFGFLYAAGDLSQQTITRRAQYDVGNMARVSVAGGGFGGPFYVYWYRFLDRRLSGPGVKILCQKLVVDQAVAGVLGTIVFFTGEVTKVTQGR